MEMKLLWTALLVYLFACYAFIFYWVRHACEEDQDSLWIYFKELWTQHPVRGWLAMAVTFVFASPLIVPYAVFACFRECRQESQAIRQLLRVHKPFAFIWLNPAKLPAEPSSYIDEHTGEMLDEGFQDVGTYIMKTMIPDYYGRVFIHNSGTTVSSICWMDGDQFFSYSSILESGRVLETTPTSPPDSLRCLADNPRITAHFATGETISGAYRRHLEKLAEIYEETGDRPLAFSPDQAGDVLEYEGRVFSREMFALGRHDAPPPDPVVPAGEPVEPELASV